MTTELNIKMSNTATVTRLRLGYVVTVSLPRAFIQIFQFPSPPSFCRPYPCLAPPLIDICLNLLNLKVGYYLISSKIIGRWLFRSDLNYLSPPRSLNTIHGRGSSLQRTPFLCFRTFFLEEVFFGKSQ